jgi:hypothetical protein
MEEEFPSPKSKRKARQNTKQMFKDVTNYQPEEVEKHEQKRFKKSES